MGGYSIAEGAVEARREPGDTTATRVTLDERSGCTRLEQRVVRFGPGRSRPRGPGDADELLFTLEGRAGLLLDGERYELEPETAVYVRRGERYEVETTTPEELAVVSVRLLPPLEPVEAAGARRVVVRLAEREAEAATAAREFRILHDPGSGCASATQFVGFIPPGRAPDHYHLYDEVIYVLAGTGTLFLPNGQSPLEPGTCIHLPPRTVHCLENRGSAPMRVLGVFRPAGSPAEAFYPDGTPAWRGS
jgi:mannose-6-phosphate isomerase-like protein (cupin superfamily)